MFPGDDTELEEDEDASDEDEEEEQVVDPLVALVLQAREAAETRQQLPPPVQQKRATLVCPPRVAKAKKSATPAATTAPATSSNANTNHPVVDMTGEQSESNTSSQSLMDSLKSSLASGEGMNSQAIVNVAILETLSKLTDKVTEPSSSSSEKSEKRKQMEKDSQPIFYDEDTHIKDNGVDVIDLHWRHRLRIPNAKPSSWWTLRGSEIKKFDKSLPVRGSNLYLEHCQGSSRPNDVALRKLHSRSEFMDVKMMLSKNQYITDKQKTVMFDTDREAASFGHKWADASMENIFMIYVCSTNY